MIRARVGEGVAKVCAHPVTFLFAINTACGALGLAQFGYTVAVLQPHDFAVIGVLMAIGGVVTGLLDVRLVDLTTRLFFAIPKEDRERRAALLSASLALHLAVGLAIGGLVLLAGVALAPRLLQRGPEAWWVAAVALRMGAAYPMSAVTALLRLVGAFSLSGWLRLALQTMLTAATVAALTISPNLTGYFAAVAITAAASFVMVLLSAESGVRASLGTCLWGSASAAGLQAHLAARRFMASGSLIAVGNLLSRSADVLLIAALTNDAVTGLYRVARQAYDTLAGLTDAAQQFYTPTIVDCVSGGREDELARHRWRLVLLGIGTAATAIAASRLLLRPLAAAHFPVYLQALPAFEVFSGLLVVTIAVHSWVWPTLVASAEIGRFGLFGLAGALAQLATLTALAKLGHLDAATAAAAAWVMAVINYGPLIRRALEPPAPQRA